MSVVNLSGDLPKVEIQRITLNSNANGTEQTWEDPHIVPPERDTAFVTPSENLIVDIDVVIRDQKQKSGLGSWLGKHDLLSQYIRFNTIILTDESFIQSAKNILFSKELGTPNIAQKKGFLSEVANFESILTPIGQSGGLSEIDTSELFAGETVFGQGEELDNVVLNYKHELSEEPLDMYALTYSFIDIELLLNSMPDLYTEQSLEDLKVQMTSKFVL